MKNQVKAVGRYIRIVPVTWHNGIGMRVELYGCSAGTNIYIVIIYFLGYHAT